MASAGAVPSTAFEVPRLAVDTAMEADASVFPVTKVSALSVPVAFSRVGVVGVLLEEEAEEQERATPGSMHIRFAHPFQWIFLIVKIFEIFIEMINLKKLI
jgi:hypothetical protein